MEYRHNQSIDSFIEEFFAPEVEPDSVEAQRREAEIFGDSDDMPADEWAIVFESGLPHEEMMVKLRALRASKQAKGASFEERVTLAERIHARGLSVRID